MVRRIQWLILLGLLVQALPVAVQGAQLRDARLSVSPAKTRIVLDLSADTQPDIFMIDNPLRLVVDLPHTHSRSDLTGDVPRNSLIRDVRAGIHHGTELRVVLDLARKVHAKGFMLSPSEHHAYRLVLDLYPERASEGTRVAAARSGQHTADAPHGTSEQRRSNKLPRQKQAAEKADADNTAHHVQGSVKSARPVGNIVVAIDPGHGGKDPGAHGPDGLLEKNVTLAIARRLKALVDDQPHMRGVLTRTGDYYVGLRQRMVVARHDKADFFISIHCDATPDGGDATGASVYALSRHGATSEHARLLARRENSADMVGGVSLKHKNVVLASFVLDLSQTQSIHASMDAGRRVLHQLNELGSLHKRKVQQADFMVLKSPDIPSILVETNFISTPRTEHRLASSTYQTKLAAALLRGIKGYFARYRPATLIVAGPRHPVRKGDTLYGIAHRYGVTVAALRRDNHLKNNVIHVGRMLKVPPPSGPKQLASRN